MHMSNLIVCSATVMVKLVQPLNNVRECEIYLVVPKVWLTLAAEALVTHFSVSSRCFVSSCLWE
jgi:hypothetical protein